MTDLKRCPFCGGAAKSLWHSSGSGWISCFNEDCPIHPTRGYEINGNEAAAIAAWNTRAPSPDDGYRAGVEAALAVTHAHRRTFQAMLAGQPDHQSERWRGAIAATSGIEDGIRKLLKRVE